MDIALHFRETVPKFAGMKGTVSSCLIKPFSKPQIRRHGTFMMSKGRFSIIYSCIAFFKGAKDMAAKGNRRGLHRTTGTGIDGVGTIEFVTALLLLSGKLAVDGILLRRVGHLTIFVIGKYRDNFLRDIDKEKIAKIIRSHDSRSLQDLFEAYRKSIQ